MVSRYLFEFSIVQIHPELLSIINRHETIVDNLFGFGSFDDLRVLSTKRRAGAVLRSSSSRRAQRRDREFPVGPIAAMTR